MTALRAALVTALSGPLARYGVPGAAALRLWAERAADLPKPWTSVELDVVDAHPSAAIAMHTATELNSDVLFGPYGAGPALAAFGATDRLVWNHGGATDRLRRPDFAHVINVPAPASSYFSAVLHAIHAADPGARSVSVVHGDTGFGREVARGAVEEAQILGFEVHTSVFGAARSADVLLVAGSFDDELAAARSLLARPWRAAAFVGAGVDEVLAPLGAAREGLLGPCQWLDRAAQPPDEGPDAAWFVGAFRSATGAEPPYPAAAAFAAGILCARTLRDAGTLQTEALMSVAERLDVRTLFGRFRLDPLTGLQVGQRVLVVQWQDGARYVVWPPEYAERPMMPLHR